MVRIGLLLALLFPFLAAPVTPAQRAAKPATIDPVVMSLFRQLNQERVAHRLMPLLFDKNLESAAEAHLAWILRNPDELSHQYPGEPDLTARAASAGAHLSVVAENIALGPDAFAIHRNWMNSPHHRDNILDPRLDAVGIAVAHTAEGYMAVADYGLRVELYTPEQVEAMVALLLKDRSVSVSEEHEFARAACRTDDGAPSGAHPKFIMRWQSPDLTILPDALVERLARLPNAVAEVGACPARNVGNFTAYRVAVLLR
jgi:hypothetical protein